MKQPLQLIFAILPITTPLLSAAIDTEGNFKPALKPDHDLVATIPGMGDINLLA